MYYIILQRLCLEAVLDIFYFPLWWYTKGFKKAVEAAMLWIKRGAARLTPGLWLKNIFVPMYGQHDFTGKVISFFMRSVQVIFRSVVLFIFTFGCFTLVAVWLVFPMVTLAALLTTIAHAT